MPMKCVVLCVLLAACGRGNQADPPQAERTKTEHVAKAVAAPGNRQPTATATAKPQPGPVEIELLHATEAKVAVSSVVANSAIFPTDLVDGKLSTAWNSRTGDLAGAWLAVRVPGGAHVTRIRMTAGFATVRGGEDWFTMNHRIKLVRVVRTQIDRELGKYALDPDNRGLQDIPIDGPGGDFKIEILDVIPGTKKTWREICVSELQVWGTLPEDTPPRQAPPPVAVGSLDAAPLSNRSIALDPLPSYASIDAFCQEYMARPEEPFSGCSGMDTGCSRHGKRACGEMTSGPIALDALPPGWTSARYFHAQWDHRSDPGCNLAILAAGKTYVLEGFGDRGCGAALDLRDVAAGKMSRAESRMQGDLLAIAMTTAGWQTRQTGEIESIEQLWICGATEPACSSAIQLGAYVTTSTTGGTAGGDGLSTAQRGWSFDWKIEGKQLVLSRQDGAVPAEKHDQLGSHRLVMPSER